jgi:hypothetical protein
VVLLRDYGVLLRLLQERSTQRGYSELTDTFHLRASLAWVLFVLDVEPLLTHGRTFLVCLLPCFLPMSYLDDLPD